MKITNRDPDKHIDYARDWSVAMAHTFSPEDIDGFATRYFDEAFSPAVLWFEKCKNSRRNANDDTLRAIADIETGYRMYYIVPYHPLSVYITPGVLDFVNEDPSSNETRKLVCNAVAEAQLRMAVDTSTQYWEFEIFDDGKVYCSLESKPLALALEIERDCEFIQENTDHPPISWGMRVQQHKDTSKGNNDVCRVIMMSSER